MSETPRNPGAGHPVRDSRRLVLSIVLISLLAAWVYAQDHFEGTLQRDDGINLYAGQRFADGVPPYVGIFDHKGPLAPLTAGAAIVLGA